MTRVWIGVDDTDSRAGGCTTALAAEIIDAFPELRVAEPPRLVRLNPNIPWKTRGNGAIALAFDGGLSDDEVLDRAVALVESRAQRAPGTEPGVVVTRRRPSADIYHAAVTRVVTRDELPELLTWGGRGVIGATAAIAWPAQRATWERIAYRDTTTRALDPERFRAVEESFPSLFDTYDLVENDVVCVPSSPCPVLYGLRGTSPDELEAASATLGPQRPIRETLFLTNQGSDDHLRDADEARPFESVRMRGRVAERPHERGGHVFARVGGARVAAYAPTRSFRRTILKLRAGDDITVCGGVHAGPDGEPTVGLEKIHVHDAPPRTKGNPACCGKSMKSRGAAAGYRCSLCGARASAAPTEPSELAGWHEVPAVARRHLARPLKLGLT